MNLKRPLSQPAAYPAKRLNTGERRCLMVNCHNVPIESLGKCADCSANLCNVRTCTNTRKMSLSGKKKFKRCEEHSRRGGQVGTTRTQKSVEVGVTVSESQIQEAEHTVVEKRSDIQRQYQRGVIVGEQEVRHEKSETHTLRVTLLNCVKAYVDTRTAELFGGAPHNELTVASSAIQVACREKEYVFEDVAYHEMPFRDAVKLGVHRLKKLHSKAIEFLTQPLSEAAAKKQADAESAKLAAEEASDAAEKAEAEAEEAEAEEAETNPQARFAAQVAAEEASEAASAAFTAKASLEAELTALEDAQGGVGGPGSKIVDWGLVVRSWTAKDLFEAQETGPKLARQLLRRQFVPKIEARGSLTPLVLACQLREVAAAIYVMCRRKELHPLYALHATALHAWSSLLKDLQSMLALWPQHLPTNQEPADPRYKSINTLLIQQGLPSVKNTPSWTCGLSKQHFEALGCLANKDGAWIWSLLDCVDRLHYDSTLYHSWVASSQLKARCAHGKHSELDYKNTFHFINTVANASTPAITCFTSPSLSMHVVNSEHEDVAARVRFDAHSRASHSRASHSCA